MYRIFVNVRGGDCETQATELRKALVAQFGKDAVFHYRADTSLGQEFEQRILGQIIPGCRRLLAVIGRDWLSAENARRLLDPQDLVRREIEEARRCDVTVIPVYVGGAQPPLAEQLPVSLRFLVDSEHSLGHFSLRDGDDFDVDVDRLIAQLDPVVQPKLLPDEYLPHYQQAIQRAWQARWAPDDSTKELTDRSTGESSAASSAAAPAASSADNSRPPFIDSQGIRLLTDTDRPQRWLQPEHFRSRRVGSAPLPGADAEAAVDPWQPITPDELASGIAAHSVGRLRANAFGLHDVHGNVWEWTADEYRRRYSRPAPPDSSARVLRGGSWYDQASYCRSAIRFDFHPAISLDNVGFRVARALSEGSGAGD